MSERPNPSEERMAIKNDPLSFREVLEQHAKDSAFVIHDISFDVVISETTDLDGTRHTTTKPFILEPAEKLKERGLQVLIGEGGTYAVLSGSYGGLIDTDDQPIYSHTRVVRLPDDFPLKELKGLFATKTNLYYSHLTNDTTGVSDAVVEVYGDDRFLSELVLLLDVE